MIFNFNHDASPKFNSTRLLSQLGNHDAGRQYALLHVLKIALTPIKIAIRPSLESAQDIMARCKRSPNPPNLVPLCATVPADLLSPTLAYLKLANK